MFVYWKSKDKELFNEALQEIFPSSTFERDVQVKSMTEGYHKYKSKYAKHLFFNPESENFCK